VTATQAVPALPEVPPDSAPPETAARAGASAPMIDVRALHKSFAGTAVLKGISLAMQPGTTTVVLGGSGSGKTVLMKHIMGLFKPDRGEVMVDGQNVSTMSRQELAVFRQRMGMVFQGAALFDSLTVGENVAFPLREHTKLSDAEIRAKVKDKLAVVDLFDVEHRYPAELSGGMRKRVGLARAIIRDPKIVLYDEPTTGLDPLTTESVDQMILGARARLGVTSVVISHDIGSAFHIADHIAMLHHGVIVAEGKPSELRGCQEPHTKEFLSTWFGRN
jgi:phospholipid/cholesterol/gamma-HCH transport system ATP-binding protein